MSLAQLQHKTSLLRNLSKFQGVKFDFCNVFQIFEKTWLIFEIWRLIFEIIWPISKLFLKYDFRNHILALQIHAAEPKNA